MSKKDNFPLNIGMSSILLIFVVLCLISFSILSIASANADKKLSQKILNRSIAYYNACNQAEETLKNIDSELAKAYTDSTDEESYLTFVSSYENTYEFPISDLQSLQVRLNYIYPTTAYQSCYEIASWKVVTSQELEYDEQLHVIP